MNEYRQIMLAITMCLSCPLVGLSLFRLTGQSVESGEVSIFYNSLLFLFGLLGLLIVAFKSDEPWRHALIKLSSQSLQIFCLAMLLVSIRFIIETNDGYTWEIAAVLLIASLYMLQKIKELKRFNNA